MTCLWWSYFFFFTTRVRYSRASKVKLRAAYFVYIQNKTTTIIHNNALPRPSTTPGVKVFCTPLQTDKRDIPFDDTYPTSVGRVKYARVIRFVSTHACVGWPPSRDGRLTMVVGRPWPDRVSGNAVLVERPPVLAAVHVLSLSGDENNGQRKKCRCFC